MRSIVAIGVAVVLAAPSAARAQRGADYIVQEEVEQGPRAGFPGVFGTATLPRGASLFTLPALGLDYGITENLSVGSSVLALTPNIALQPTFFGRARYRFHSSQRWRSVIDVSGGLTWLDTGDDTVAGSLLVLGNNVTYRLGPLHSFTGSALALRLVTDIEGDDERSASRAAFSGLLLAATHELMPTDWFSLRTSLVFAPAVRGAIDEIGSTTTIEIGGTQALLARNALRVLTSFRVADRWLLTAGGMLFTFAPYGLPWLSVAKQF